MMDELAELDDIRFGGRNVNNFRYADDMIPIAASEKKLQSIVNRLHEEFNEKGLRINTSKIEVM